MALRDHFHPPLAVRRHWHSFHNAWATAIAVNLNTHLPDEYFAEPNVQFGVEIDVATLQEPDEPNRSNGSTGREVAAVSVASASASTPPEPVQTLPFQPATDTVEVMIYNTEAGPTLVGAIELVSPANKDRAAHRDAFVSKCETLLRQGVGLVIIDIVTNRKSNLHNQLLARVVDGQDELVADLYAASYRSVERSEEPHLDIWTESLTLADALPISVPFWLRGDIYLPLELKSTYERICQELRIE